MASQLLQDDGFCAELPPLNPDTKASFKGYFVNGFFIGREHPIDYSKNFIKRLQNIYWENGEVSNAEIDLASGSKNMDEKPTTMSFGVILDYLMSQRKLRGAPLREIIFDADIVCRRGALNKLFHLPYQSDFLFGVKKFQGVYFISELPSPKTEKKNTHMVKAAGQNDAGMGKAEEKEASMTTNKYHMFLPKFKKCIIAPYGDKKKYAGEDINTWDQYQGVFVADFTSSNGTDSSQGLRVFYGSEVDCLDIEGKVVEIKLQSRDLSFARNDSMIEKYRKWYFQSKLVTCETMVVGIREQDVVTKVKRVNIDDLHILIPNKMKWNLGTSCDIAIKIFSMILGLYDNAIEGNQTLVIQSNRNGIKYYVRGDDVYNLLPEEFKTAFGGDDVKDVAETTTDISSSY